MKLPPQLGDLPQPLYFFDGHCVLCSGFVGFCLGHDGDGRLRFASTQSVLGQHVVQALGLPVSTLDRTILLIEDDTVYMQSSAALRSLRHLKGWPRLLQPLLGLPAFLRDPVYDLIARNRYRWFGRRSTCHLPP
jgi:predicted DCC family thiol-disulfide oxidoreductase YuxK